MKKMKTIDYQRKCKICGNKNLKKVVNIEEQYLSATFVKTNYNNPLKNKNAFDFSFMCFR